MVKISFAVLGSFFLVLPISSFAEEIIPSPTPIVEIGIPQGENPNIPPRSENINSKKIEKANQILEKLLESSADRLFQMGMPEADLLVFQEKIRKDFSDRLATVKTPQELGNLIRDTRKTVRDTIQELRKSFKGVEKAKREATKGVKEEEKAKREADKALRDAEKQKEEGESVNSSL